MSKMLVVGGGVGGLSTGIYGQMNGFDVTVLEQHNITGGLLTAWKRKDYLIDGCIHWLVGTRRGGSYYNIWKTLGVFDDVEYIHHDVFMQVDLGDGEPVTFYVDPERLAEHLKSHSPEDAGVIDEFCDLIRKLVRFGEGQMEKAPELMGVLDKVKMMAGMAKYMPKFIKYGNTDVSQFASRFKSAKLREVFENFFIPEMPIFFLTLTMTWIWEKDGGYPIGGSMAMAKAMEQRYRELGGTLRMGAKVDKILVENHRAVGVRLENGEEIMADWVVSAADLHATMYDMLDGQYLSKDVKRYFEGELEPFDPLVYVGLGFDDPMDNRIDSVSGTMHKIERATEIAGVSTPFVTFHTYTHDPTLAPSGKTVATMMLQSSWEPWARLAEDKEAYKAEKARVEEIVRGFLQATYPDLAEKLEMVDVSTPVTFHRYTNNWRGSYEGWKSNLKVWRTSIPRKVPGLERCLLAGHWLQPAGGLPPAASSGRFAIQVACKEEGRRFHG